MGETVRGNFGSELLARGYSARDRAREVIGVGPLPFEKITPELVAEKIQSNIGIDVKFTEIELVRIIKPQAGMATIQVGSVLNELRIKKGLREVRTNPSKDSVYIATEEISDAALELSQEYRNGTKRRKHPSDDHAI